MLEDGARSSRLRRNALHLSPVVAGSASLVDAATSGSDDVVVIARVNVDGKDIRVVNDSVLNGLQRLSAIRRLVGKVPGAGINDIGAARVDGERFDMNQSRSAVSRQLSPGLAGVVRTKYPVEGSGNKDVRIQR